MRFHSCGQRCRCQCCLSGKCLYVMRMASEPCLCAIGYASLLSCYDSTRCGSICYWVEQHGQTALIWAAMHGHHECVSILVANGADVNVAGMVSASRLAEHLGCTLFDLLWQHVLPLF